MNELPNTEAPPSPIGRLIGFCLDNKIVVAVLVALVLVAGLITAPFDWELGDLPRSPVPVDAIPDIGENQQIVFTRWPGRSPQDVEDQVTYPLTTNLLGMSGVKAVRGRSMFGFSSVTVVFEERVGFDESRNRILTRLAALGAERLPTGVQPSLGPEATALGQIFWYTLEGRDPDGRPAGGWDPHELRIIQDRDIATGLQAPGIAEVASIGGFVPEYQIDVDPDALRAHGVTLTAVLGAVRRSNLDVGARTIEISGVENVIRARGFIQSVSDIESTVVSVSNNVPITVGDIARVSRGPALRRGALDKGGAEAVGGVAVVAYGYNPLQAIENVKDAIERMAPGMPRRAVLDWHGATPTQVEEFAAAHGFEPFDGPAINQKAWLAWLDANERVDWPAWITTSQVTIVPFYDRTGLIHETLGTLRRALTEEILVTSIVAILIMMHFRSSLLVSGLLPLAVLMSFFAMRVSGVDANIVALSGIAIAIGTMVDMGIIMCENILRRLDEADPDEPRRDVVLQAAREVGGAITTAVSTTIVSFLPVFVMVGEEGKLFRPLAFTKTFALLSSVIVAIIVIPPAAHLLFGGGGKRAGRVMRIVLASVGVALGFVLAWWAGIVMLLLGLRYACGERLPDWVGPWCLRTAGVIIAIFVAVLLADHWMPISLASRGAAVGRSSDLIFIGGLMGGLLGFFYLFRLVYVPLLRWCLAHKTLVLLAPVLLCTLGACIWQGFDRVFAFLPVRMRNTALASALRTKFPGLGREFMPPLDEGSFLFMPSTMPHASIGEARDVLRKQDMAISAIPEVHSVVGKLGRAETPLDPAPVAMFETLVNYVPEYIVDSAGGRRLFRFDRDTEEFAYDADGRLIEDPAGRPFRQWRDHIHTPDDIWTEIERAATIPGTSSAAKDQPISVRLAMLRTGTSARTAVQVSGPDQRSIERAGLAVEKVLKGVEGIAPSSVRADRVVGKPYITIEIDREAIKYHKLTVRAVQDVIEVAIGGRPLTWTVEGRERFAVRVRYPRELRDTPQALRSILVPTPPGPRVPLGQLTDIRFERGPQAIFTEDTRLVGYVIFGTEPGAAETDTVERAQLALTKELKGKLPNGVSFDFVGSWRSQLRARRTLSVVLPVALLVIFLILYIQFRRVSTTLIVFIGVFIAWSGGFLLLWLYAQDGFLDITFLGVNMRDMFQIHPINMSVAVWVGFLALFGIATDDGVVIATYLKQSLSERNPQTVPQLREAILAGAARRIRPCLMTSATTILALIPVLTSTGRGADVMVPMAIPSFGGMTVVLLTVLVTPVLYCLVAEWRMRGTGAQDDTASEVTGQEVD